MEAAGEGGKKGVACRLGCLSALPLRGQGQGAAEGGFGPALHQDARPCRAGRMFLNAAAQGRLLPGGQGIDYFCFCHSS